MTIETSAAVTTDAASQHTVSLADGRQLVITTSVDNNGALVVYMDTEVDNPHTDGDHWEPTADKLRVNVNDGPVFNYPDATRWYGDDQGWPAPVITYADVDA